MFGMLPYIVVIVVGALVTQFLYTYLRARRRARAAVAATAANGLVVVLHSEDPPSLPFALFQRGEDRKIRNRMWDPSNPSASVFDYRYSVTSGGHDDRSTHTYRQTCAAYSLPFSAPAFALTHVGFVERSGVDPGSTDLVVGDARFDATYRVACRDQNFVRGVLDRDFVAFMLREAPGAPVRVEMRGPHLLLTTGRELPPDQFAGLLAFGHRVIGHLPAAITGQQGR